MPLSSGIAFPARPQVAIEEDTPVRKPGVPRRDTILCPSGRQPPKHTGSRMSQVLARAHRHQITFWRASDRGFRGGLGRCETAACDVQFDEAKGRQVRAKTRKSACRQQAGGKAQLAFRNSRHCCGSAVQAGNIVTQQCKQPGTFSVRHLNEANSVRFVPYTWPRWQMLN